MFNFILPYLTYSLEKIITFDIMVFDRKILSLIRDLTFGIFFFLRIFFSSSKYICISHFFPSLASL